MPNAHISRLLLPTGDPLATPFRFSLAQAMENTQARELSEEDTVAALETAEREKVCS